MLGVIFRNQTTLAAIFVQLFSDFARIFDKSKLFGNALAPPVPVPRDALKLECVFFL